MRLLSSVKRKITASRVYHSLRPPAMNEVEIHGVRIFVRQGSTDATVAEHSLGDEFDPVVSALPRLRHNFIIDAGGYIGTAAIALARAYPDATIVTIEPSIANFSVLKKNVSKYKNIVPLEAAIGPKRGRLPLYDRWSGQWGYSMFSVPGPDCPDPVLVNYAEIVTVEDLMKRFRKNGVDVLKLDIEGGEVDLLSPIPPWINRVEVVFAELHDRFRDGCTTAFEAATAGRQNWQTSGEKVISVCPSTKQP